MTRKVYYLSTCDTCKRIMKEAGIDDHFSKQDIKTDPLTEEQIEELYRFTQSYEELINKRARKFKEAIIQHPISTDADYKILLLQDYTFLTRPAFIIDEQLFIGNSKATIEQLKNQLNR